ncbi:zinc-binding dehydrogenase [Kitasatospora sp. NBC_01287]|uniref:quinone oxidoreductase family protein n=1 Tax=Kitasatospora sp. NBC_01287 TaxID=2903573 RepID=UPI00225A6ACA|nr:zinc-binding dehydrogenase [Kitasatospora sp. NBC_01287]MCX4745522.1 zinc-binding dehydrogenase [Kitasatospora sp. NBC_01287]
MRAIMVDQYGGPEVLRLAEVGEPEPGPGQVSVEVAYAGINFAELKARSTGYRVPALPFRPGLEVSGVIRAIGPEVPAAYGLRVGQPVAALTLFGGYAEVAVADAARVFPLPAGVSLRTAAALPTVLPTAHALLHEVGRLRAGESVLVQSAAGGVGGVVGQLAKLAGAGRVYGVVSSAAKVDYTRRAGYDEVFIGPDFSTELQKATEGRGVDLALDAVGGRTHQRSLEALTPFGRLVSFGNASDDVPWKTELAGLVPGRSVAGFSLFTLAQTAPATLRELAETSFQRAAYGAIDPLISAEFPLEQAGEAHRLIETRTTTGKLLLAVNPPAPKVH